MTTSHIYQAVAYVVAPDGSVESPVDLGLVDSVVALTGGFDDYTVMAPSDAPYDPDFGIFNLAIPYALDFSFHRHEKVMPDRYRYVIEIDNGNPDAFDPDVER